MTLAKIQVRRGTSAEWAADDPVLADGEPGLDTDLGMLKFGNGVDVWSDLPLGNRSPIPVSQQAGSYTFVLGDGGTEVESTSATAVNFTIPPNSSVAFPVGTPINARQMGDGQITIVAGVGVTVRAPHGVKSAVKYGTLSLIQRAADEWVVGGDATS